MSVIVSLPDAMAEIMLYDDARVALGALIRYK
jgi:hypothetical protein